MAAFTSIPGKTTSWPISIGAEGIAAAQFARCGFDVLVQAGRDKSWYDLVVSRAGYLLKVSVKASENGRWSLTSGYSRRAMELAGSRMDCPSAVDMWLASYGSRTVCCLVQFENVALDEMPRIYLAFPQEIALRMRETSERVGQCALLERYEWNAADGSERMEMLPVEWRFSERRIEHLLDQQAPRPVPVMAVAKSAVPAANEKERDAVLTA